MTAAPDLQSWLELEHRVDYWAWVDGHPDTDIRDSLLVLREHWRDMNARFFDSVMVEPYITLDEPAKPQQWAEARRVSSWGSRLEIRIRPSLAGAHRQFVQDALLHEMIHQHIVEQQPGVPDGHGPEFTDHANRIGAELGLPAVVDAAQWPMCVAPPDRYGAAWPQDAWAGWQQRSQLSPVNSHTDTMTAELVWQTWRNQHDALWERALELRQRGNTLPAAYARLGLLPEPKPEPRTLKDIPRRLRDELLAEAHAQVLSGLKINQLPQGAQQALLAQTRAQLKHST
jgi:hypothetical protein